MKVEKIWIECPWCHKQIMVNKLVPHNTVTAICPKCLKPINMVKDDDHKKMMTDIKELQELRSAVECIVSHAITECMHRIVILDQTPEEAYKSIGPDVDFLTKMIINERKRGGEI